MTGASLFETLRLKDEDTLEEEQIRGWSVRISRDNADKAMFITAQSDRQIALGNDSDALRRFLMEEGKAIPLPAGKKTLIGRTVAGMAVPMPGSGCWERRKRGTASFPLNKPAN